MLLSVLVGARLGGIVGALFAIPAAGTIQVLAREVLGARGVWRTQDDDHEESEVPSDSSDQLGELPVAPAPSRTAAPSTTHA